MDGEDLSAVAAIAAFVIIVTVGIVTPICFSCADRDWQKKAVEHKAAEFYLDKNMDRQWRWLDESKEEEK